MNPYVLLTKLAVENYIREGKIISPPEDLPKELLTKSSGAFVTIYTKYKIPYTKYQLRGCIGTYLPTKINIAEEIIHNAVAAATEDYRFGSIKQEELPHLSYTGYILNPPELVKDIKELNPKKFGIIIKTAPISSPNGTDVIFNGHMPIKSGLLLPDLEGVDTVEKQISIACQKGGIDPTREKIIIYRFTTEKYAQ